MNPVDLDFLCALVQARSGLVIPGERGYFAEARLGPLARREGAASVADLAARLRQAPEDRMIRAVVEAMTIQETAFFRDRATFRALANIVVPGLARARGATPLRVWSAGCGTGQEPWSLAMMMAAPDATPVNMEIMATDLCAAALEKAESGLYTHFEVQRGLPVRALLRHFQPVDEAWRIRPDLRASIRWKRLNLVDPFSVATPFDLILCRHVLDRFDPAMASGAIARLDAALAPDGCLVLGPKDAAPAGFVAEEGAQGLFRREEPRIAWVA